MPCSLSTPSRSSHPTCLRTSRLNRRATSVDTRCPSTSAYCSSMLGGSESVRSKRALVRAACCSLCYMVDAFPRSRSKDDLFFSKYTMHCERALERRCTGVRFIMVWSLHLSPKPKLSWLFKSHAGLQPLAVPSANFPLTVFKATTCARSQVCPGVAAALSWR